MQEQRYVSGLAYPVAAAATRTGRLHEHNEDAWWVPGPEWPAPGQLANKGHLYVVADGIGGHAAGDVASRMASETIAQTYYRDPDPDIVASLERAIQAANGRIYHMAQQPSYHSMGSTAVAAVVRGGELVIAHAGDSRAYLLREGDLQQLTNDHTWVAEGMAKGLLTPEEAASHPQRNVITRSLGNEPLAQPELNTYAFLPGDRLLLCSDGVSGVVPEVEMARQLGNGQPGNAARALVKRVTALQGTDDATALVVESGPLQAGVLEQLQGTVAEVLASPQQRVVLVGTVVVLAAILLFLGITSLFPGRVARNPTATPTTAMQAAVVSVTSPTATLPPQPTETPTPSPTDTPAPSPTPPFCVAESSPGSSQVAYAIEQPSQVTYQYTQFEIGPHTSLDGAYPNEVRDGCADPGCPTLLPFVKVVYQGQTVWILQSRLGEWQHGMCVKYNQ
jgi:serine/threonine protein phosphatase PrpC